MQRLFQHNFNKKLEFLQVEKNLVIGGAVKSKLDLFNRVRFVVFILIFLKFFLLDTFTCPILGPLIPLFGISGDVSSGFQRQSGFCLICIAERNVVYIP